MKNKVRMVLLLSIVACVSSCVGHDTSKLNISADNVIMSPAGGVATIVSSNRYLNNSGLYGMVEYANDWIVVQMNSDPSSILYVTVSENTTGSERRAFIDVTEEYGLAPLEITVHQAAE